MISVINVISARSCTIEKKKKKKISTEKKRELNYVIIMLSKLVPGNPMK